MQDVPRSERFADVYFSSEDGPGETAHVFFDGNGLPERWQGADRFVIGETGFGTGLNFLLAWELFDRTAPKGAILDYVSVEKYPLTADFIRKGLSPWAESLSPYLEKFLALYPARIPGFHRMVFDGRVALTLVFDDANDALPEIEGKFDAWFLDGFTPSRNPDMWTDRIFAEIARLSTDGTTFSTFTAAGFVKRALRDVGFEVRKTKGFGFKWSMLSGVFRGGRKKIIRPACKTVAIHGAGLAGCATAHALRQYGFTPVLFDPNGIAFGASGNAAGLINPRFTAFRGAESDFYASAFALGMREFPALGAEYRQCGAVHLVTDRDKEKRFARTLENWAWQDGLMYLADADAASDIAGVELSHAALVLPTAARINPAMLCRAYADGVEIASQIPDGDALILANGIAALGHPALSGLPLHTVRGQITEIETPASLSTQKTNICYGGYAAAPVNGKMTLGSTFQKWLPDATLRAEDDTENIEKLRAVLPQAGEVRILGARAGLRVAAKDRFPVIGPAEDRVFASTAHGSHGILSSLLAGHILADFLRGGPFCIGKSTLRALSPLRFD